MSFIDIKDPKRRDAIVAEYLSTMKRIQKRNIDERVQDLVHQEQLTDMFNPMVKSNEESTAAIVDELKPLKEEIEIINKHLKRKPLQARKRRWDESGSAIEFYLNNTDTKSIDAYLSIQRGENGELTMGDKVVRLVGNDIIVDRVKYKGTPGLWSLIMASSPKGYSDGDLENYKELVRQTNVIHHPRVSNPRSRPFTTNKWRNILERIGESGSGILFLPRDIKGLNTKLNLLLAEYAAGNRSSTRNEIVYILDEVLRRKRIPRKEYTNINTYLSK